jgi:Zn finger protein HypA/HybF involved in hydrogenase expression
MEEKKISIEKMTDVLSNPEHPLMQESLNTFNSKEGDTVKCKNCGQDYKRGAFDFYKLCNPCFSEQEKKKMESRMSWLNEQTKKD